MSEKKSGGPAFPGESLHPNPQNGGELKAYPHKGMSLRDYFASKLIEAVFMDKMKLISEIAALMIKEADDPEEAVEQLESDEDLKEMIIIARNSVAKECYAMADAMLKAREEQ